MCKGKTNTCLVFFPFFFAPFPKRSFDRQSPKVGQKSGQRAHNSPSRDPTPMSYCRKPPISPMIYCRNPPISNWWIPTVSHGWNWWILTVSHGWNRWNPTVSHGWNWMGATHWVVLIWWILGPPTWFLIHFGAFRWKIICHTSLS